jgi:hypothetical protein
LLDFASWVGVAEDFREITEGRGQDCSSEGSTRVFVTPGGPRSVDWRCSSSDVGCREEKGPVFRWNSPAVRDETGLGQGEGHQGHKHPTGSGRFRNFNPGNFNFQYIYGSHDSGYSPSVVVGLGAFLMLVLVVFAWCVDAGRGEKQGRVTKGRREALMNPLGGIKNV